MPEINKADFPSNSLKKKIPKEKNITKITTGSIRKKSFMQQFLGEHASSVGEYILFDVLIPAAKNTISDIVANGIEMLLYGEPRSNNIRRDRHKSYVSYSSYSIKDRDRDRRREEPQRNRARHRFDDVLIETRADAEEVLSSLVDIVDQYGVASIADFYDLVGINSDWSDHKYGWDNLGQATVQIVRGGYVLVLPKPFVLD